MHHPDFPEVINLNYLKCFWKGCDFDQIGFTMFEACSEIIWQFGSASERDEVFNALLTLTSQNLCTAKSPIGDPQQTCPTTQEQNNEKHPPHPETNPF